jgi:hypothetical protein
MNNFKSSSSAKAQDAMMRNHASGPLRRCLARVSRLGYGILTFVFASTAFGVSITSTFDSGGGISTSATYVVDSSLGTIAGNSAGGSVSNSGGGPVTQPSVTTLSVAAAPVSVSQGGTSQLSGTATMDDTTVTTLTGSDITWGSVTYPFQSVDGHGVLTAVANVYASPVGTVSGSYLGATGNASVQVLGPYANAGIPDAWLVQYFGMPPNPNAAPTADADGTGQNNLFKYVAGLDPRNPASVFVLQIQNVNGQPSRKNLMYNPIVSGRTYTAQFSTDLVGGSYAALGSFSGPMTNGNQATVTDLNATQASKFYRIRITYP